MSIVGGVIVGGVTVALGSPTSSLPSSTLAFGPLKVAPLLLTMGLLMPEGPPPPGWLFDGKPVLIVGSFTTGRMVTPPPSKLPSLTLILPGLMLAPGPRTSTVPAL